LPRKTRKEKQTSPELISQISKANKNLMDEFIEYLKGTAKSLTTINAYTNDLFLFFVWNLQYNDNKFFIDYTKRDVLKYQNHLVNELELSPNRVRRRKATLSSLSNFIESMMDDLYPTYKPIINKIPSPPKQEVREKTVLEDEQIEYLLNYLVERKQYQKACIFALAGASGSRKSEFLRFKVSYFTDENIIYGSLYKTPEKIKTKGRGQGKFIYRYCIVAKFKPYLDLWLKQREELGITCDELFVNKRNGEWNPLQITGVDSYADTFSRILGLDFYWHSLRHYFCTTLSKCNIPASVIKDIIGWENVAMVDIYDDTEVDDELGKYFDADGIKVVEQKGLGDLK
jgi:site-specific recombinase XerD